MMPFSDKDIYEAVQNNLPKVSTYVNSHGGDITLLGAKDGVAYIELLGSCKGCAMSLMTTKMVVQRELRTLIHPTLNVVNIDESGEHTLPNDVYTVEPIVSNNLPQESKSIMGKVKSLFS
ncbi:MAG: NifU family protein [Campylobacterota bacterium]|nr:NifU family protein [Campylobacterota bacterium]